MKKLLILLLGVCFLNATVAQISDDEEKQLYQEAGDEFDAGNFNECYHIYQKDRTPQDVVNFLNESARKFPGKNISRHLTDISRSVKFKIDSPYLRIVSETVTSVGDRQYIHMVEVTFIDLSQVTGLRNQNFSTAGNCQSCSSWGFSGPNDKVKDMFQGTQKMTTVKGIASNYRSASNWKDRWENDDYKTLYSDTSITPDIAFTNWENNGNTNFFFLTTPTEYYNGTIFDQTSSEFQNENFEKRIIDAFQYLVDYFPKKKEEIE